MVSPWNNIIIRGGGPVDPRTLGRVVFRVVGSVSGAHDGETVLATDGLTFLFKPYDPFALGETVTVTFEGGARSVSGTVLAGLTFSFVVSKVDPKLQPLAGSHEMEQAARLQSARGSSVARAPGVAPIASTVSRAVASATSLCDTVPETYPNVPVMTLHDPDPDHVFVAPYGFGARGGHLMIMDQRAETVFYRQFWSLTTDFKLQPFGLITYFTQGAYHGLDSAYTEVESWQPGNGYNADSHELQLLANGHALLFGYDPQPVRMDSVVAGGDSSAIVTGLIIQELDLAKDVIFQWRSWDHFEITDADSSIDLTGALVDYVHGNSIEVDHDGNLLISSRHLNEITKVDRLTGDVIWRMGLLAKRNEFTFVNDSRGFSYQHDARRLPNGHITLFDNGNLSDPLYSRAVEYEIDEVNKIATLVWEYRYTPDILGPSLGSVQRRANGATMICWGGVPESPKVTELHADGSIAFELGLDLARWTYRAFRFPWETTRFATDQALLDFASVDVGDSAMLPLTIRNTSDEPLKITCFKSPHPDFTVSATLPHTLGAGETLIASVMFKPTQGGPLEGALYVRSVEEFEIVARSIEVRGIGGGVVAAPDPALAYRFHDARPNPFSTASTITFDLPRAEYVTLEIFDLSGRRIDTLIDGARAAGRHGAKWEASGMKNGLYFYRIQAGAFAATRKIAIVR